MYYHFYPRSPRGERRPCKYILRKLEIISIHAPREGSDPYQDTDSCRWRAAFLSTLPARGATFRNRDSYSPIPISIHAPREGSDLPLSAVVRLPISFLSTLPARGATMARTASLHSSCLFLSTLPARGATHCVSRYFELHNHFYPRSPRGERRRLLSQLGAVRDFYPRSPRGERHMR